jgi:hypothetical protein
MNVRGLHCAGALIGESAYGTSFLIAKPIDPSYGALRRYTARNAATERPQ